jgi:ERO1-like protein alpha
MVQVDLSPLTHSGLSDTYVQDLVDMTITAKEKLWIFKQFAPDISETLKQPDFWLDICKNSPINSSNDYLNLNINPERRTGYNGSHVWHAIYEEMRRNLGHQGEMDLEERMLYKLISGLHASVTIHVALQYHKPPDSSEVWMPNAEHFQRHFGGHPERLENLHFAFAVLLRAVHRASNVFRNHSFQTWDDEEDLVAMGLVHRLLDAIEESRPGARVSQAFDESLLFREGDDVNAPEQALKKDKFKHVFHNISELTDCITCQVCALKYVFPRCPASEPKWQCVQDARVHCMQSMCGKVIFVVRGPC